jgi:ribosome maturation factor RimP
LKKRGYHLYDVIYEKEDGDNYLRVLIRKKDGPIDFDDCEKVNNLINDILDEKDFISDEYYLEVSSEGIEKRLRTVEHLEESIGEKVKITVNKKPEVKDNKKNKGLTINKAKLSKEGDNVGILTNFDNDSITITVQNNKSKATEEKTFKLEEIIQINKYFDIKEDLPKNG